MDLFSLRNLRANLSSQGTNRISRRIGWPCLRPGCGSHRGGQHAWRSNRGERGRLQPTHGHPNMEIHHQEQQTNQSQWSLGFNPITRTMFLWSTSQENPVCKQTFPTTSCFGMYSLACLAWWTNIHFYLQISPAIKSHFYTLLLLLLPFSMMFQYETPLAIAEHCQPPIILRKNIQNHIPLIYVII